MAYLFKYYAGVYDRFMERFKLDSNEEIIKSLGDVTGKKVLDIGGGTGTLANLLQRRGAQVTLVDPSATMTQKARAKNEALIIYANRLEELKDELVEKSFDVVMIRDALHHIPDAKGVIALSAKYLKNGGSILIWEFNKQSIKAKVVWWFETLCFEKCRMFTPQELKALCAPFFQEKDLRLIDGGEMLYKGEKRDEEYTID